MPFSLKLMESLLTETPRHRGLLVAACSGFTQYAYALVQEDADEAESQDLARATALRGRARSMYARARNYCLRSLALKRPAFEQELRSDPRLALRAATKRDVASLYWTAASWGGQRIELALGLHSLYGMWFGTRQAKSPSRRWAHSEVG